MSPAYSAALAAAVRRGESRDKEQPAGSAALIVEKWKPCMYISRLAAISPPPPGRSGICCGTDRQAAAPLSQSKAITAAGSEFLEGQLEAARRLATGSFAGTFSSF